MSQMYIDEGQGYWTDVSRPELLTLYVLNVAAET